MKKLKENVLKFFEIKCKECGIWFLSYNNKTDTCKDCQKWIKTFKRK